MKKSLLSLLLLAAFSAQAGLKKATIVSEPAGDGQQITQVLLEYDELLHGDNVPSEKAFEIKDRTISHISLGKCIEPTKICRSHELILHLGKDDPNTLMTYRATPKAPSIERKPAYAIKQVAPITVITDKENGTIGEILPNTFHTERVENRVLDSFVQREFKDANGTVVKYNLYVPENYDPQKRYPLVLFLHDAGATNTNTRNTLFQGNGATSWASPEVQAEYPTFVLAPQFDHVIVNEKLDEPAVLEPTIDLIKSLQTEYAIDENRLYVTGQSTGAMLGIAMNIKYPNFFAASYLVAGQWAAEKTAPMARNKVMMLVSENDQKAFNGQNAISEALALHGAQVQKALLSNGSAEAAQIEQEVQHLLARTGNVYSITVKSKTLPEQVRDPNGDLQNSGHSGVWKIAYNINAVRDWLLAQTK